MTAPEFEACVVEWARLQPDVVALVQIGSRVQQGAVVDEWSDWDYQVIVRHPERYFNRDWPRKIAPCWSVHFEKTERRVTKLSAIFAGGFEVDFVLLSAWQLNLVCRAMRYPGLCAWFPSALRRGIRNLRLIAAPGYRVVLGGPAWERRYAAIGLPWPVTFFSAKDFEYHLAGFWRHAVWVAKKILRGELRAAIRWSHVELRDHLFALLEEEARLEGRLPRPEARQAERWLKGVRLEQTAGSTEISQRKLAQALLVEMRLCHELTEILAKQLGFVPPDYGAVENWLRSELSKVAK